MKTQTTTSIEITFTGQELCDALQQASISEIRSKVGDVVSSGVTPRYSVNVDESDNSAILKVTLTY